MSEKLHIDNPYDELIDQELAANKKVLGDLFDRIKSQLKSDMNNRLQHLFDNFDVASQKCVNCVGEERSDPTLYLGSGGVLYALLRTVISQLDSQGNQVQAEGPTPCNDTEEVKQQAQQEDQKNDESEIKNQIRQKFEQSLEINKELLRRDAAGRFENSCASFYMAGTIGFSSIEVLNSIQMLSKMPANNEDEQQARVLKGSGLCSYMKQHILSAAAHCLDDINEPEDEILYGTAGYLQCLLLLKKAMVDTVQPIIATDPDSEPSWADYSRRINSVITQVTLKLIEQTKVTLESNGQQAMQVLFPRYRRGGQQYIGGAHGTLGVLYVVTQACLQDVSILQTNEGVIDVMKATFEDMLHLQTAAGGFKFTSNAPSKIVNHWCHGAPGAIGPLLAGVQLFIGLKNQRDPQEQQNRQQQQREEVTLARRLYEAACKAAELTWRNGLLFKGNSLCHGISGNGLLLHSMARWHNQQTQETEQLLGLDEGTLEQVTTLYRIRALMFARAMSQQQIQEPVRQFSDHQRLAIGTPDHPWSLMEGIAGEICMLADLVHPDDLSIARFPGFDAIF